MSAATNVHSQNLLFLSEKMNKAHEMAREMDRQYLEVCRIHNELLGGGVYGPVVSPQYATIEEVADYIKLRLMQLRRLKDGVLGCIVSDAETSLEGLNKNLQRGLAEVAELRRYLEGQSGVED